LYEDLSTSIFYWIPYDTDNTFGIDWFGIDWASVDIYDYMDRLGGDRPLYEQMLTLPEYRDRFTYYVEQLIDTYYNNEADFVNISAEVFDDNMVTEVTLHYSINNENWESAAMILQGENQYEASIEITEAGIMNYYIKVRDDSNQSRNYPKCGDAEINVGFASTPALVINEIMASNTESFADENGEYDDWVEIYNADSEAIELSNYYLSDNPENPNKWQLPEMTLMPDSYIIIWADEDGSQGDRHANFNQKYIGASYSIININGEKIASDIYNNEINISSLSSGMYYIQISINGKSSVEKFVLID